MAELTGATTGTAFGALAAAAKENETVEQPEALDNENETVDENAFAKTALTHENATPPTTPVTITEEEQGEVIYVANRPMLCVYPEVGTETVLGAAGVPIKERRTVPVQFVQGVYKTNNPALIKGLDAQVGQYYRRANQQEAQRMMQLAHRELVSTNVAKRGTDVSMTQNDIHQTSVNRQANLQEQKKVFVEGLAELEGPVPNAATVGDM